MSDVHSTPIAIGTHAKMLAGLVKAKLPVPAGFVVSSEAFEEFIAHNLLQSKIEEIMKDIAPQHTKEIQTASRRIKKMILSGEFPPFVSDQILRMYVKMGEGRVMLFPSVFLEDFDNPLFAHFEEYYFGYEGDANLFTGIREVWSHFFDPKPLFYRLKHGKDHFELPFAISVQQYPKFKVSGVMHTSDPTIQNKNAISIKVVYGEGGLTHDLDNSDYYWVNKNNGQEIKSVQDKQKNEIFWRNGEAFVERVPISRQTRAKLSESQLRQLSKLALAVTQHFFFPHEVTFGANDSKVWLIEVKPMQLHGHAPVQDHLSSAAPITIKPVQKSTNAPKFTKVSVGLIHHLTAAGHLPTFLTIGGSYLVYPDTLLASLHEGKLNNFNVISHELVQRLVFLFTRSHPEKGFLYFLAGDSLNSEQYNAQIHALLTLRHKLPATPLGIVVGNIKHAQEYSQIVHSMSQLGIIRSSALRFLAMVSVPALVWDIEHLCTQGLDGVIVDCDALAASLAGASEASPDHLTRPAFIETISKASQACQQSGITLYLQSVIAPNSEMLSRISSLQIHQWISDTDSFLETTEHFA